MLTLLNPPTTQPVSVDEAKAWARVDGTAMDALIGGLIGTARESAEQITGRCYMSQVQRYTAADWPAADQAIKVHAVTAVAIEYWTGSAWQELAPDAFAFFELGPWTGVAPAVGASWPALGAVAGGPRVRIDLTAGAADADDVPDSVKTYIYAQVSNWVNNPDALVANVFMPNPQFGCLLDGERLWA